MLLFQIANDLFTSVMETKRVFNEILWHGPSIDLYHHPAKFAAIFKKFGPQIETIRILCNIDANDITKLLRVMPNLTDLQFRGCYSNLPDCLPNIAEEDSSPYGEKLRRLEISSQYVASFQSISCPVLEELRLSSCCEIDRFEDMFSFIRHCSQLKIISAQFPMNSRLNGFSIDHLQLDCLKLCVEGMPEEFLCDIISSQKKLKSLTIFSTNITDKSLRLIVNHPQLEELDVQLDGDLPISEKLIAQLSRMRSLKIRGMTGENEKLITEIKSDRLEKLSLPYLWNVQAIPPLSFAENLPNLKILKLNQANIKEEISLLNFAVTLKNLETLVLNLEELDTRMQLLQATNPNVRELKIKSLRLENSRIIKALVRLFPNVEKVSISNLIEFNHKCGHFSTLMNRIFKFPQLKEFRADNEFLTDHKVIEIIKKRGQSLRKISADQSCTMKSCDDILDAYEGQYAIIKYSKCVITMERI